MARAIVLALVLAALGVVARADQLILTDGRVFTGTVTVNGDTVTIVTSNATLNFPKDQVDKIDQKPTPESEYQQKLADISLSDTKEVVSLAQWASTNGLDKHAQELYGKVIAADPDHAEARKALGYIKLDGQWMAFAKALEMARGKLEAGKTDALLKDLLPALETMAPSKDRLAAVRELTGLAQLRSKEFAKAGKTFAALAEASEGAAAVRLAAIAEVLKDNADGMYVLAEPYPPTAGVLSKEKPVLEAGPASLSDPLVLQAAIRERAKKEIDGGRKLMEAAAKLEPTDADAAKGKYSQALQTFDRAEAMVPDIARSYRIEISRRRIATLRKDADAEADRYDKAMNKLGKTSLTAQEYQAMMLNLIHLLDNVRDNLNAVITLAKVYPRDLVLEQKWAEQDLRKIEGLRKVLLDEINGQK